MKHALCALTTRYQQQLDNIAPSLQAFILLALRLWLAWLFFKSGLSKLDDWDTTVFLFTEEYQVPLLPPPLAAFAATAAELILPLLLTLGLATRFAALGLFILNAVAVISYPVLEGSALDFHYQWGLMLLVLLAFGAGKLSLDAWWLRRSPR